MNVRLNFVGAVVHSLLIALIVAGCNQTPDNPENANASHADDGVDAVGASADREPEEGIAAILSLKLSDEADENGMPLVVRIRNNGQRPFAWDSECVVPLHLIVRRSDGSLIDQVQVRPLVDSNANLERFRMLQPREVISKEFDIVGGARRFWHARQSFSAGGESVSIPVAGEDIAKYEFDRQRDDITIEVAYDGFDQDANDAFSVYFKQRPNQVGLPRIALKSEKVLLVAKSAKK